MTPSKLNPNLHSQASQGSRICFPHIAGIAATSKPLHRKMPALSPQSLHVLSNEAIQNI